MMVIITEGQSRRSPLDQGTGGVFVSILERLYQLVHFTSGCVRHT